MFRSDGAAGEEEGDMVATPATAIANSGGLAGETVGLRIRS